MLAITRGEEKRAGAGFQGDHDIPRAARRSPDDENPLSTSKTSACSTGHRCAGARQQQPRQAALENPGGDPPLIFLQATQQPAVAAGDELALTCRRVHQRLRVATREALTACEKDHHALALRLASGDPDGHPQTSGRCPRHAGGSGNAAPARRGPLQRHGQRDHRVGDGRTRSPTQLPTSRRRSCSSRVGGRSPLRHLRRRSIRCTRRSPARTRRRRPGRQPEAALAVGLKVDVERCPKRSKRSVQGRQGRSRRSRPPRSRCSSSTPSSA